MEVQVGAGAATRLQSLESDISSAESDLAGLKKSSQGPQGEADSLQAKIDSAGGQKLKQKKLEVSKLQEVRCSKLCSKLSRQVCPQYWL